MNYTFTSATILLLLITDPFGNIPIFTNALKNVAPQRRARVILREILIAFLVLLTFMFAGDRFLTLMNLSGLSLQMAGGVACNTCLRDTLRGGGTLFFCGNGGSAADAQHVATEYVVRYVRNRRGLAAVALVLRDERRMLVAAAMPTKPTV